MPRERELSGGMEEHWSDGESNAFSGKTNRLWNCFGRCDLGIYSHGAVQLKAVQGNAISGKCFFVDEGKESL